MLRPALAAPLLLGLLALAVAVSSLGMGPAAGADRRPAAMPPSKPDPSRPAPASWVPGEVLVQFERGVRRGASRAVHARRGARVLSTIGALGGRIERVALPPGLSVQRAISAYRREPGVAEAEPNLIRRYGDHPTEMPAGRWYRHQWGLHNVGQRHKLGDGNGTLAGKVDADVDAPEAWQALPPGADRPVIAVVDSGVDVDHPDIAPNLWENPGEIPDNGIDDDGNGCVDDVHGRSFGTADCTDLRDRALHGTHVAGIIAGAGAGSPGILGVCPHCRIMVVKMAGAITLAKELAAFEYAREMGADVVNGSFGGPEWSGMEYRELKRLQNAEILAVFAAGNDALDNDLGLLGSNPLFPASYLLDSIVSVAASNHRDHYGYETRCDTRRRRPACAFSSFGRESVDVAAPGVDVVSSLPGGGYAFYNGTSMAAPHVAGIAGLVLADDPGLDAIQVKNKIMNGADRNLRSMRRVWSPLFPGGKATGRFTRTSGRANAKGALDADGDANATRITDGNVDGAKRLGRRARGRVSYPRDVNDVYRKRLQRGRRYRAVLRVPRRKDFDLWVWHPRVKQIWQYEIGCFLGRGRCPIVASGIEGKGKNEVLEFRARRNGWYYFHVAAWVKQRGKYRLIVKPV